MYSQAKEEEIPLQLKAEIKEQYTNYRDGYFIKNFNEPTFANGFFRLTRKNHAHCPLCDRVHENDNIYFCIDLNNLIISWGCYRNSNKIERINKPKGHLQVILHNIKSNPRKRLELACSIKLNVELLIVDHIKEILKNNRTAIISGTGTGKTEAIKQYLLEHPELRVLLISFRKTLAYDLHHHFTIFEIYLDDDINWRVFHPRFVVQLETTIIQH